MARDTLFRNWFFGRVLRSIDVIPVRRGQADLTAVKAIIQRLKQGRGVCLYPEGTRTADGKISQLKAGFGLLSRKTGAPIIPMVMDGAFECWPRNKKIFSPGSKISVKYGKAISADEVKALGDEKLAEVVTERLRNMQNEVRTKNGKPVLQY